MSAIERRVVEVVDRLLLEHGELDPVDCLVEFGLLRRADADAPLVAGTEIISALLAPVAEAVALLEQAHAYAVAQNFVAVPRLEARPRHAPPWPREDASQRLMQLCGSILRRADGDLRQTDLFHDGAQTATLNELKEALVEHRTQAAGSALQRLRALTSDVQAIDDYGQLLSELVAPRTSPAECSRELELRIAPLARRYLGPRARAYLWPLWSDLAMALSGMGFDPETPHVHASYAHAQAEQWDAAATCVEREPGWPRHAALVARLAEARARQGREDRARRLWAQLCWDHPGAAADVLAHAPGDPVAARLWSKFIGADAELSVGDFPAWLLLGDSFQAHLVPAECAPDSADGHAYAALHRLVTSGGAIGERIALHALRPDLLRLYLAAKTLGRV